MQWMNWLKEVYLFFFSLVMGICQVVGIEFETKRESRAFERENYVSLGFSRDWLTYFFFFSSSSSSWNCLTMRNVIIIFIHYVHGLDGGYCGYMKYKKYILVNIYVSKIKRGKKKRKKSFGLIFHLGAVACGREIWFSSQMIFILFFFFLCIYTGDQYSF